MKGIYSFYLDCGRSGSLEGIFVADSADVANIIGNEVYFGEVLGKHSEVVADIDAGSIELETNDQDFISKFEVVFGEGFESGFNPLNYWDDSTDEDVDDSQDEDEE